MDESKPKIKIGEIRKAVSCCSPQTRESSDNPPCGPKPEMADAPPIISSVSSEWKWREHIGHIRCRISGLRMRYAVQPGLYAVGSPGINSDVFVSANYKLSFDILRRSLKGINAWILVLDTKGINVWCAAGKGTFGTDELVKRIGKSQLENVVSHRRIIVPQLGAPGVAAHIVQQKTGFRVYYGPVDAKDIRQYIETGYKATDEMRKVKFRLLDRLVLTPMEIIPAMKVYALYVLIMFFIIALKPSGIIFKDGLADGLPFFLFGFLAVLTGAFVTPLLLPYMPFRAFVVKGWIAGVVSTLIGMQILHLPPRADFLSVFSFLVFPLASSYIALQFTGSTTFTGMSGVKKELRYAMPVYISAASLSFVLLVIFKLRQWGIL
jgi:hypothetical protein